MDKNTLTKREKDVLCWAAEGKTAWEIGAILSISERTVKFHLSNIYRKLGVHTRAQALMTAIRNDLFTENNKHSEKKEQSLFSTPS